jgi:hypothetical protein
MTMENSVFWNVAPCGLITNRRLGGKCRLHLQDRRNIAAGKSVRRLPRIWRRHVPPKRRFIISPHGATNRRLGGKCRLHLQDRRNILARKSVRRLLRIWRRHVSSETSVYNKATRRHIPEDGIHKKTMQHI